MDIGQRIKMTREHQGISMNALSKKSGAAQSAISEIESGKRQPTFEVLERIVTGLGFTLSDFFADHAPELPPYLRQMLDIAQKLTPIQRDLVTSVMKEMAKDNQLKGE